MLQILNGWLLPGLYSLGFILALCLPNYHWRIAKGISLTALFATLATMIGAIVATAHIPFTIDKLGLTVALLIALLGWVIVNYSAQYLEGEPNQALFVRAMLFTLAAVGLLVVSGHLAIIVLAWSATSIGLHYLLTYYNDRKAAQIVAHKKFLVSRLAELCLFVALGLIYYSTGTLNLTGISSFIAMHDGISNTLPITLHWAAALFALAAILKSAQLPLHGWLIQVMEAPTPVSALLHAGIVNIGGFVLIRLAELVSLAPAAQIMLVIVGSLTAVLAGLVMMTRVSIKVRLAWSTCAQMGFMLMEIGLGLYELALLHLVAHSFYKAYAFLGAGETVTQARANDFYMPYQKKRALPWYIAAFAISTTTLVASIAIWQLFMPGFQLSHAVVAIVALGLAPLLWLEQGSSVVQFSRGLLQVFILTQLYLVWHVLFADLAPAADTSSLFLLAWVITSFTLLYLAQIWLRTYPQGKLARVCYPWAYYGFYLDEAYTRLTFKIWPARLKPLQAQTLVIRHQNTLGDIA